MSIVVRHSPVGLTRAKYDEVNERLDASGDFPPVGMKLHILFGEDGELRVSELWDSTEEFEAFGSVLMPILEEAGVQFSGPPEVLPIQNLLER
jgi:hypothetical protein